MLGKPFGLYMLQLSFPTLACLCLFTLLGGFVCLVGFGVWFCWQYWGFNSASHLSDKHSAALVVSLSFFAFSYVSHRVSRILPRAGS
jgi:hypothetical protein